MWHVKTHIYIKNWSKILPISYAVKLIATSIHNMLVLKKNGHDFYCICYWWKPQHFTNATKHFAKKLSIRYIDLQTTLGSDPNLGDGERVPANADKKKIIRTKLTFYVVVLPRFILAYLLPQRVELPLATRAWVTAMLTTEKGTAVQKNTLEFTQNIIHLSTQKNTYTCTRSSPGCILWTLSSHPL